MTTRRINYSFRPGSYWDARLPDDDERDEVEIAPIELQSVTGDVVSIRARRDPVTSCCRTAS